MNLEQLREYQILFESNLVGTDGDLCSKNTPEICLKRGIIGESLEALSELEKHGELSEEFRQEVVDIYIFFATLLNHVNMSSEELSYRTSRKMTVNFLKYRPEDIADKTVLEGIAYCKDNFNHD